MSDTKCIMGCKHFTGGEIKHHKDCPFYPDSLSKMYDDLKNRLNIRRELIEFLDSIRDYMRESGNNIANDERPSREFVDIFMEAKKENQQTPPGDFSDSRNIAGLKRITNELFFKTKEI